MRFSPSIFGKLLEPIDRRAFGAIVARHDGDAYDKSFRSWDHMVALIYAQFSAVGSLRALEAGWNANRQHHYHLASGALTRSTCRMPASGGPPASSPRFSPASPACSTARRGATAKPCCA